MINSVENHIIRSKLCYSQLPQVKVKVVRMNRGGSPKRLDVLLGIMLSLLITTWSFFSPFTIFSFHVYTSRLIKCTCNTKQLKVVRAIRSTSCQKNLAHIGCAQSTLVWIFLERMEGYNPLTLFCFPFEDMQIWKRFT